MDTHIYTIESGRDTNNRENVGLNSVNGQTGLGAMEPIPSGGKSERVSPNQKAKNRSNVDDERVRERRFRVLGLFFISVRANTRKR